MISGMRIIFNEGKSRCLYAETRFPLRMHAGQDHERDVLERLRDGLPPGFDICHNITLHTLQGERDRYGTIDIAVLAPTGALLPMEVKAGAALLLHAGVVRHRRPAAAMMQASATSPRRAA
jgi:hypothetical protein